MGFFSFKSLTTDSNFNELLGMIYFPLCWMEIVLWIHRTSHYKLFFSGFLPLTVTFKTIERWISLAVRSWGIRLPMQRTRVQSLVWEDSHAVRPVHTNTEVHMPTASAPQREKPLQREAGHRNKRQPPRAATWETRTQQRRPSTAKTNKKFLLRKLQGKLEHLKKLPALKTR